ncbi:MAG: MmcQ/YjbR family DNA-binding protein [Kofleriaceae bacterium]
MAKPKARKPAAKKSAKLKSAAKPKKTVSAKSASKSASAKSATAKSASTKLSATSSKSASAKSSSKSASAAPAATSAKKSSSPTSAKSSSKSAATKSAKSAPVKSAQESASTQSTATQMELPFAAPKPKKAGKASGAQAVLQKLRDYGMSLPGTSFKSPWPGHKDLAVNDKTYAYLSIDGEPFSISCKLPQSSAIALMLPFASPTPYGLGKSGWVSAQTNEPDYEMFRAWIEESYRAQAPKKFVKQLG